MTSQEYQELLQKIAESKAESDQGKSNFWKGVATVIVTVVGPIVVYKVWAPEISENLFTLIVFVLIIVIGLCGWATISSAKDWMDWHDIHENHCAKLNALNFNRRFLQPTFQQQTVQRQTEARREIAREIEAIETVRRQPTYSAGGDPLDVRGLL